MVKTLYSAGEIIERLKGVTTRQILDIAEKGLIVPARETTGAGSPRLYDFQNVFEICICLAVRGRIPAPKGAEKQELTKNILWYIRKETARAKKQKIERLEKLKENSDPSMSKRLETEAQEIFKKYPLEAPPFDVLLIDYETENNYRLTGTFYKETLGDLLADSKKYKPQNFCTYNIEVLKLWKFLRGVF